MFGIWLLGQADSNGVWSTEVIVSLSSVAVAATALGLSMWTVQLSRRRSGRQQFLDLQSKFLDVFEDLPSGYQVRPWKWWSPKERKTARRYWFVAQSEWLATKNAKAQASGCAHPGLRGALEELLNIDSVLKELWKPYIDDLNDALESSGQEPVKV